MDPADTVETHEAELVHWARHAPVTVYLVGTFAWAWALWGYWVPAMPAGGLEVTPAFIACALIGGLAPSLAAFGTSWLIGGQDSVRHLLAGLRLHAPPLHYIAALGGVPLVAMVGAITQSLVVGPILAPDPSILAMAAVWPILAALGEEFGWRGFLFPRLLHRFGLMGAAVIVGLIWGVWHLPADFVGLKGYGPLFIVAFLINGPYVLTAHALIMAWLWRRTGANLLMMILYHWSITVSAMLVPAVGGEGVRGLVGALVSATLFWVVAGGLWVFERNRTR